MSATITIDFAGGSATSTMVSVALEQCTVSLQTNDGVAYDNACVTNLSVRAGELWIATGVKAELTGTLAVTIDWSSPQVPEITLNNVANAGDSFPTVSWPTDSGLQQQILTSGNPLALAGIVSS